MGSSTAAPAEIQGNKSPAEIAVPSTETGIGILGLIQDDGRIASEIEVVDINPSSFSYTQLITKPCVEEGWDMLRGEVSSLHASHLAGVAISEVRILSSEETPEGQGEHVRFAVSTEITSSGAIRVASMAEYQGPAEGLIGCHIKA